MVKQIDDMLFPPLEDHIGVRLWHAAERWKALFNAQMVELGHTYFGEARAEVLRFVGPGGTKQSEIVRRMNMSKQAVQQLVDELEAEKIVRRTPDKSDARGRLVVLTGKGISALHDANAVKRNIQLEWGKKLGRANVEQLMKLLAGLDEKLKQE